VVVEKAMGWSASTASGHTSGPRLSPPLTWLVTVTRPGAPGEVTVIITTQVVPAVSASARGKSSAPSWRDCAAPPALGAVTSSALMPGSPWLSSSMRRVQGTTRSVQIGLQGAGGGASAPLAAGHMGEAGYGRRKGNYRERNGRMGGR
jgi:hypothetical protein